MYLLTRTEYVMELLLAITVFAVIVPVGLMALVFRLSAGIVGWVFGAGCSVAPVLLVLVQYLALG
jgi:hypothetical protein